MNPIIPAYIAVLISVSILLFGCYAALRVHLKKTSIGKEEDYIDRFLKERSGQLTRMNSPVSISTYCLILLISPLAMLFAAMFFTKSVAAALVFAALGGAVPDLIVRVVAIQAGRKFEERYAQSLEQMGSSLTAGLSIAQAVNDVVQCKFLHPSIRKRYARLSAEITMGIPINVAFRNFADNVDSQDARDVALALDVQNEVGGKEAEVVLNIAENIKNRIMLRREVNSIFASTSSMIVIMDYLPITVILISLVTNRSYTRVYFSNPLYTAVFAFCVLLPLLGNYVNHKSLKRVRRDV